MLLCSSVLKEPEFTDTVIVCMYVCILVLQ